MIGRIPTAQPSCGWLLSEVSSVRRCLSAIIAAAAALVSVSVLTGAAAAGALADASQPARLVVTWHKALEVPGTAALNVTGQAQIETISCPAAGYCTAGGLYSDASHVNQAFTVTQRQGKWGNARELPGTAALDLGGQAYVQALSCAVRGFCTAAGSYLDASAHVQVFVAGQSKGTWGKARPAPGLSTLNASGQANVNSVSCGARGACSAGGGFKDSAGHFQAFVITENKGSWGHAVVVPGTAALNTGGSALVNSVSCTSAGNCVAGGFYTDAAAHEQGFVVRLKHGHWGKAQELRGSGKLNTGGDAEILSVSCASAGNCSAGGFYTTATHHQEALIALQRKGTWAKSAEVPGTAKLNSAHHAVVLAVSCARGADCSAVGYFEALAGTQAFVVNQAKGKWGRAATIPALAKLNKRGFAQATSVSCAAARSCSAAGFYFDASNHSQAFAVTKANGKWGRAIEIPRSGVLNKGLDADVYSVACASAGNCSAGGFYKDAAGNIQAFLANETARRT